jgi:hypothetical protein
MKKFVVGLFTATCALVLSTGAAFATYTAVSNPGDSIAPGVTYVDNTNVCTIDGVPPSPTSTCTDGAGFKVILTPVASARQVPSSWATWSSPPFSESATPKVAFFGGTTGTLYFGDRTGSTTGSEWEPNAFATFTITCNFNSSGIPAVITVSRAVAGASGARLFAVNSNDPLDPTIDTIACSIPAGAIGFATAQIRGNGIAPSAVVAASDSGPAVNNGVSNAN